MAMDALKNLVNNVPGWLQRLDDLSSEIDKRQAGLAAVAAAEGKGQETKSSKRKHHEVEGDLAQMEARKKIKLLSPTSNKDAPAAYRTRCMTIVYYHNYAQCFFNELVRLISSSGVDLMCKAEKAIRETKIRRLAKQDASEDGNNDDEVPLLLHTSRSRSDLLRNKGSTKSLKPKDDPSVVDAEPPANEDILEDATAENAAQTPAKTPGTPKVYTPSPGSIRQQQKAIKAAQARARVQVRKKPKSRSMVSNEDAPAAYRTRNNGIVYYDNYAESFFAKLVRFVWSSRNLMHEAKMAARVAQIKKLAEQDVSEDGNNKDALPSLRYMSSRRFGTMSISRPDAADQPHDVYDNLDKGLEFVQSQCEHGAHQFLRDGDCNDEISKVQKRLSEVFEMAKTEMGRIEREEPELAKETGEMGKVRTRRPISMRRGMPVGLKEGSPIPTKELEPAKPTAPADPMALIEVDPDIIEADEGIDVEMELLTLQYRSTRAIRRCGPRVDYDLDWYASGKCVVCDVLTGL
ncbi:uncharacterized protein QYS62_011610 [Fusarium acuminatum]|uniref:Uncharacterized protein n=1 Tax=Fusarium acuminatum TaxID=5515 RepID=A0ABZ2XBY4_9HYPO